MLESLTAMGSMRHPPSRLCRSAGGVSVLLLDGASARRGRVADMVLARGAGLIPATSPEGAASLARSRSADCVVLAVERDTITQPALAALIRLVRQAGMPCLCYADGADDWPLALRCRLLVLGAHLLFDSASSSFCDKLDRELEWRLRASTVDKAGDRDLLEVIDALGIVGRSPAILRLLRNIGRLGPLTDLPVLLLGETGTGKELLARALHRLDPVRRSAPLKTINCAALPASIAEAELYLDSPLGLTTGREVHGWPKEIATFDSSVRASSDLLSGQPCSCRMSTEVTDREVSPARFSQSVLLEIVPRRWPRPIDLAANWRGLAGSTLAAWSGLARSVASDAFSGPASAALMQLDRWRSLIPAMRERRVVTLKQFRDPASPEKAGYQALIVSALCVQSLGAFGLVGASRMYAGDFSGGHEIRIARHDSHPIVDLLGLRVDRATEGRAFTLRPALPFWFEMNLEYRTEAVLCERATGSGWLTRGATQVVQGRSGPHPYNDGRRPFQDCVAGPFEFKDTLLRVLRFRGHSNVIERACRAYDLHRGDALRPRSADVYLIFATGEQCSVSSPNRRWPFALLGLYIPVEHSAGISYIAPFELVDHPMSAIAGREVEGRAIWLSTFRGAWLQTPEAKDALLLLSAASPLFGSHGGQATCSPVIEITSAHDGSGDGPLWPEGSSLPELRAVHLRQYRDAADAKRAAYQKIATSHIRVVRVHESGQLPRVVVRVHRYGLFSIAADLLGTDATESNGGGWLRADMRIDTDDSRSPDEPDDRVTPGGAHPRDAAGSAL